MEVEWGTVESAATLRKRGFDFAHACRILSGDQLETIGSRRDCGEVRVKAIGKVDRAKVDATTEEDIRRHMIEDGEDPGAEPRFEPVVLARNVRKKLGMTQAEFAALLRVPVATLRNWEQNRFVMEPAARTLLNLIDREPEAALRALRRPRAA
jgi:putative transcriptional regulator